MEQIDWLGVWRNNQIPFHQAEVNRHLAHYLPRLDLDAGATVFVPLCGKSHDMTYLLEQGLSVIGVDLSPLPLDSFTADLDVSIAQEGPFLRYSGKQLCLLCGDFFALERDLLNSPIKAVYDRGSLIALPAKLRGPYVQKLQELTDPGTRTLLICVSYEAESELGPPYSVNDREVRVLYEKRHSIQVLCKVKNLEPPRHLAKQGVGTMESHVYLIEKRSS